MSLLWCSQPVAVGLVSCQMTCLVVVHKDAMGLRSPDYLPGNVCNFEIMLLIIGYSATCFGLSLFTSARACLRRHLFVFVVFQS